MANVIITSAGRRVTLLRAFAEAVKPRGGRVIACDVDPLAPTLYEADIAERLPLLSDATYSDALTDVVKRHAARVLVPTIDPELPVLARLRERLLGLGCVPLVSSAEFVEIAGDKWLTVETFSRLGYRTPSSWLPEELDAVRLPDVLFVKPRKGSAGKHTYRVDREHLHQILGLVPQPIVQEYIDAPELTVDALLDMEGRPVHYVVRQRLKVVGGESVEGVTVKPQVLERYLPELLSAIGKLGGLGPITLQLFLKEEEPILSEINPRFGGGFPLAWYAGARYPEWILDMVEGKVVEPKLGDYRVGVYMTRYYTEIFTSEPLWNQ